MKKSVTVVFTLLFFLVLGVYLYLENRTEENQIQESEFIQEEMKLLALPEGDFITRIKIQRIPEKETIILSREEEGLSWMIDYPIHYPADPMMANGLQTALTLSYKVRKLKPQRGWEEYGLKDPVFKIGIQTRKSAKEKTLCFGDRASVGNFVFARWSGENEYFLLPAELKSAFLQSLYALRQKNVFALNAKTLSKIHLKTDDEEYELAKNKDKWFWMEPIPILGELIPNENMGLVLRALQNLSVKEFLDKPFLDATKLGLDASAKSVVVFQGDAQQVLTIGNEEAAQEAFYAKREKQESPYSISSTHLNQFFQTIHDAAEKVMPKKNLSSDSKSALPAAGNKTVSLAKGS